MWGRMSPPRPRSQFAAGGAVCQIDTMNEEPITIGEFSFTILRAASREATSP